MRRCTRRAGWVPPRRRHRCADQVRPVASSAGQSSPHEPGTAAGCPRTKGLGRLLGPSSASIWSGRGCADCRTLKALPNKRLKLAGALVLKEAVVSRSEGHTSELQSHSELV